MSWNPTKLCGFALLLCVCGAAMPASAAWENTDHTVVIEPLRVTDFVATASDGFGGLLVAAYDSTWGATIVISRISHTGDELWGDGGVRVPNSATNYQYGPVAVAPDGAGGAYLAYSEGSYGNPHHLYLAHFLIDGTFDWSMQAGDFGFYDPGLKVEAIPSGDGDVILVWTYAHSYLPHMLLSACYSSDQTQVWTASVGDNITLGSNPSSWSAVSDEMDGALVAFDRQPSPQPDQQYVQRISSDGSLAWGAYGLEIWNYDGAFVDVVANGFGGALVTVQNNLNEAWVQHIYGNGTVAWATGGVQVFNAAGPFWHSTVSCSDGGGGLIMVSGLYSLSAQRIDYFGSLLWNGGALNGVGLTGSLSYHDSPSICTDGEGGAHVIFRDDYYCNVSDPLNYVLYGVRLDHDGTTNYPDAYLWLSGGQDGLMPMNPEAIADGSGGALVAWQEYASGMGVNDVRALGVDRHGAVPPEPYLTVMSPDAAFPDGTQYHVIEGAYLEMTMNFELQQPGQPPIAVLPVGMPMFHSVSTMMTPVDAAEGAWSLLLSDGGAPVDTLVDAIGIGPEPPCDVEELLGPPGAYAYNSGSKRKADFDSWGNAFMVYMLYTDGAYQIYRHSITLDGMATDMIYEVPGIEYPSALSFAIDNRDEQHVVFTTVVDTTNATLRHLRLDVDGNLIGNESYTFSANPAPEPVIAVTQSGAVVVVVQFRPPMANSTLGAMYWNGGEFEGPFEIGVGPCPREPDMTAYGDDGLILTYVSGLAYYGENEVCFCEFDGLGWGMPEPFFFGLDPESPSVAWDGNDSLLFAWISDVGDFSPRPFTCRMDGGELGPIHYRPCYGDTRQISVAAAGDQRFLLQTNDSEGGVPWRIGLRYGNGHAFYPLRQLNTFGNVDSPVVAAARDGSGILSSWESRDVSGEYLGYYWCRTGWPAPVPEADHGVLALQAHPNPFNPKTTLVFELPAPGRAKLSLYDLAGRRVRTLIDGDLTSGTHERAWDGRDDRGRRLASGVFLARLEMPGGMGIQVSKVMLIK